MNESSILPYFSGAAGEACRAAAVSKWVEASTPLKLQLDAVMTTDLFQMVKSRCQSQIDLYNEAAAMVCLLETTEGPPWTYDEFWAAEPDQNSNGAIYFDGDYDLATMFGQTQNFTDIGSAAVCLADCYTGLGPGCDVFKEQGWMVNYGKVSVANYCDMQWAGIDNGYNAIKLCASKAIANPDTITKEEFVNNFRSIQATEQQCWYKYCYPALATQIEDQVCTMTTTSGDNRFVLSVASMQLTIILGAASSLFLYYM
mmetsp:Transcript_3298/g.4885  ORF Transcript_3298/g.4885 Transcript_3298/m.4885 type:complete len:257 (+) Transcript_3298:143-913(+)